MARTDNFKNFATDVADSIRSMTGKTGKIPASQFDTEIKSIETKEDLDEELNTYNTEVTEQGVTIESMIKLLKTKGSSATQPEKGIIINEVDENGNATDITILGIETIPNYYIGTSSSGALSGVGRSVKNINIEEGIKTIGSYAFANTPLETISFPSTLKEIGDHAFTSTKIELEELPNGLETIGNFAFNGGVPLKIKTIPNSVTSISYGAFYEVRTITQMSVNVSSLSGQSSSVSGRGVFQSTTGLIACWIGNKIETLGAYAFSNSTNLKVLYIDLPRSEVEALGGYSKKFTNGTNTTVQIISNEDEGFMTKEEFDAIDWETYTG